MKPDNHSLTAHSSYAVIDPPASELCIARWMKRDGASIAALRGLFFDDCTTKLFVKTSDQRLGCQNALCFQDPTPLTQENSRILVAGDMHVIPMRCPGQPHY